MKILEGFIFKEMLSYTIVRGSVKVIITAHIKTFLVKIYFFREIIVTSIWNVLGTYYDTFWYTHVWNTFTFF